MAKESIRGLIKVSFRNYSSIEVDKRKLLLLLCTKEKSEIGAGTTSSVANGSKNRL